MPCILRSTVRCRRPRSSAVRNGAVTTSPSISTRSRGRIARSPLSVSPLRSRPASLGRKHETGGTPRCSPGAKRAVACVDPGSGSIAYETVRGEDEAERGAPEVDRVLDGPRDVRALDRMPEEPACGQAMQCVVMKTDLARLRCRERLAGR